MNDKRYKTKHPELIRANDFIHTCINEDGTNTIYIFSAPMGKRICIQEDDSGYFHKNSLSGVRLPKTFSMDSGISIGEELEIFPVTEQSYSSYFDEKINVFGQKKKYIAYRDFYDNNVDLNCYVTSFGINTEIVIPEYTGNNVFELKLKKTNKEVFAAVDSPDYITFRTEPELKFMVYTPLAVDANRKRGFINHTDIREEQDGSYTISYVINKIFLESPEIKYPVTLNQSIYLYRSKQPDTAIYSGTGDTGTHHLSPYIFLGDKTVKGEGWGFIRYDDLNGYDVPPDKVISAHYYFNNLFDHESEVTVGAYAIMNDWCSINTRWKTKPGYNKIPVSTTKVKNYGLYKLDITPLFIEMMKGKNLYEPPYSIRNSFFIKSLTKGSDLLLASADSGIFSPYLKIVIK